MSTTRQWETIKEYEEILFEYFEGIAKITINRPRYRNAFTPLTTLEMSDALHICHENQDIYVVVLTGAGDKAFCSGGDQNVKGKGGYIGKDGVPRLQVLEVQKQIRSLPKPVIAMLLGAALQITNSYGDLFIGSFKSIPEYAESFGVKHSVILLSLSQMSETLFILTIPFFLKRFGIKQVMLMSMGNIPYLRDANIELEANLNADLKHSKYTLKKNKIKVNDLEASLDGWVAMLPKGYGMAFPAKMAVCRAILK